MAESTIITSLCWVSRGFSAPILKEYEPSSDQYNDLQKMEALL
jgi:hypothetical protein